jgi:hypothetical protein
LNISKLHNFTADFENQIPAELAGDTYVPGRLANSLILQPVLVGIVATALLALPVPSFLSLLYPTTSPHAVYDLRKTEAKEGEPYRECALSNIILAVDIFRTNRHCDLAAFGGWSYVMIHDTNWMINFLRPLPLSLKVYIG